MAIAAPTVDEYLTALPNDVRVALQKLRKLLKQSAPGASEQISYGIPSLKLDGCALVGFGGGKDYCALYLMGTEVMKQHAAEVGGYASGKGTLHFSLGPPLPTALIKKLVAARIAENESRLKSKVGKKTASRPTPRAQPGTNGKTATSGKAEVDAFMATLVHPHKAEIELVRSIILKADSKVRERVKWNAPSFHVEQDLAAFNLRAKGFVQLILIFPNGLIEDETGLLQGDWKDRREARFTDLKDVKAKKAALTKVIKAWVEQ